MSIERVKKYFKRFGISGRIKELDSSSATVELAAQALNCEPERIAKTLALNGAFVLINYIDLGNNQEIAQMMQKLITISTKQSSV